MNILHRLRLRWSRRNWSVIKITYDSGAVVVVETEKLTVKTFQGKITSVDWAGMSPKPMFLNVDAIESIYQIK